MATAIAVLPALTPLQPAPAAAAVAPAPSAPGAVPAVPSSDEDTENPPLVISEITPEAVGEKSTVTVTGRVSNTTENPIGGITVRLRYNLYPLADRAALDAHAEGSSPAPFQSGPSVEIDADLPPGASAPFELEVDAEDLDLRGGFGVYPLTVDATSEDSGEIGVLRTFLPYTAGEDTEALEVAWVWPLMDRPRRSDDDTYLDADLPEELTGEGRLGRLLSAGSQDGEIDPTYTGPEEAEADAAPENTQSPSPSPQSSPSASPDETPADEEQTDVEPAPETAPSPADPVPITWAVDPGLLDDIQRLGAGGYWSAENTPETGAGPALAEHEASIEARVWLAHARLWLAEDPLLATPYADTDLPALLGADLEDDAQASITLGRETVAGLLGREADPSLAWPAQGTMDEATRDLLAANGATTFVLDDSALPARRTLGHTPSAAASLPVPDRDDATALVADSGLTRVLGADSRAPGSATLARQRFAAETAMISAEGAGSDRTLVLAPPRDWDPSPEYATGLLEATEDLPWLEAVSLADVEADAGGTEERQGLAYPDQASEAELDDDHLERVHDIRRQVQLFNSALTEDGDPFRPSVLRVESAWWRDDEELGAAALARVGEAVQDGKDSVHVIPGDPITLASKNGTLGVLVANDLSDHSVTVHLSIFSENSERLSIGEYTKSMEIGPGGKTTVYVPLSATVNGRTVLHMSLHNADGEPISDAQTMIPVNVTGLGTGALVISGAAALVLVAALAPRAVRKWTRERSGVAEAAAGPDPDAGADAAAATTDGRGGDAMHDNGRGPVTAEADGNEAVPAASDDPAGASQASETAPTEGQESGGVTDTRP
ncbi:hypothetical protein EV190_101853 [Actinorugispora endophytica]|uniref:Secreted protein n=2 Tax=Actinorugispora endophytica TaxID=1605990 RepID=A0A4R6V8C4_9ACTN|nr:hypothetical protein EV190_101853 [Actinorugispora endophytica]